MKPSCLRHLSLLGLVSLAVSATRAEEAKGVVFHDQNGNGIRDAGEPGLPDIAVSNQREIVQTDAEGRWSLPVTDDTIFFVVKPSGWMTRLSDQQIPQFYYLHKP
jgi:hypothetical protein